MIILQPGDMIYSNKAKWIVGEDGVLFHVHKAPSGGIKIEENVVFSTMYDNEISGRLCVKRYILKHERPEQAPCGSVDDCPHFPSMEKICKHGDCYFKYRRVI